MKNFILTLLISVHFFNAFSNQIDSLKTDQEIASFISSLPLQNNYHYSLIPTSDFFKNTDCNDDSMTASVKNWYKLDVNTDGKTDLLAIVSKSDSSNSFGTYTIAIIELTQSKFNIVNVPSFWNPHCSFVIPTIYENRQILLLYKNMDHTDNLQCNSAYKSILHVDTLIYKFGGFTELTRNIDTTKIKSLSFRIADCMLNYGYLISLDSERNVKHTNYSFNSKNFRN